MSPEINDIIDNPDFLGSDQDHTDIKVIGVGGGGNNAINHMYRQGIKGVSFVVCNTDRQALLNSPVPTKVLLGKTGLGAGNKPEVAREAAESTMDAINQLFDDDTKMVFVTAGMGGGTGTGAGPIVARAAKERGLLTIGIVTIPFLFEGEKKILKALNGADEMSKNVDALLVINNERLTEIYPDLDFLNGFAKADDTLTTAARSISELITCDGYMNVDFNDVDTTLRGGGTAIISSGYGEGEHRVTKAIDDALNSPLLKYRNILGSKKLLFNLYFSRDAEKRFAMDEVSELTKFVSNIDSEVDVIWGVAFDESLGDKVKITILAAGFDDLDTDSDNRANMFENILTRAKRKPEATEESKIDRMREEYGSDKIEKMRQEKEANRYIILTPDQFDDDEVVETLESVPAFNRDRKIVDQLKAKAEASTTNEAADNTLANNQSATQASEPATPASPSRETIDFSMDD